MKTTLIAILSGILAVSVSAETAQEAMDAAYEWVERESARQEARQSHARQEDALEDIRRELADAARRRQAQAKAREEAQMLREQQWSDYEQRRFAEKCRRRVR